MSSLDWFFVFALPAISLFAAAREENWTMSDILTWISKIPRNVLGTTAIALVSPFVLVQSAFASYELSEVPGNVISQVREIITEIRDLWTLRGAWSVTMPLVEIDQVGRIHVPETRPTGAAAIHLGLTEAEDWNAPTATTNTLTGLAYWTGTPQTTMGAYQAALYNQFYGDPMQYVKTPLKAPLSSITPTPEHRVH
jgi:amino acid transporter